MLKHCTSWIYLTESKRKSCWLQNIQDTPIMGKVGRSNQDLLCTVPTIRPQAPSEAFSPTEGKKKSSLQGRKERRHRLRNRSNVEVLGTFIWLWRSDTRFAGGVRSGPREVGSLVSSAPESSAGTLRGRKAECPPASAETCIPPPLPSRRPFPGLGGRTLRSSSAAAETARGASLSHPHPPPALRVSSLQGVSGGWGGGAVRKY